MINLVTGYKGIDHITSDDDANRNASFIGVGKYVVQKGKKLSFEVITNNHIRIYDGEVFNQGRHIRIEANDYEDITIDNGTQSLNRCDLIVLRFSRKEETGIEGAEIIVLKGNETSGLPNTPEYIKGDLFDGDLIDDMPLYKVNIEGINIVSVDRLFNYVLTMDDIFELYKSFFNKRPLFLDDPSDDYERLNND